VRVVRRGRRRELYVDGTFASCWEPGRTTTGPVWDALALPLLGLPPRRRRRVLVLGLAGGSAARLVRALAPRAAITGVEYDADVLAAARRHMGLDALGVRTVRADARRFLAHDRSRYDLVIDDVFVGRGWQVHKPDWLPEPGLGQACRRLASGGLLVANALDESRAVGAAVRRRFPACVRIDVDDHDNRIWVGGPAGLGARRLRAAAAAEPILADTLPHLRFRTSRPRP